MSQRSFLLLAMLIAFCGSPFALAKNDFEQMKTWAGRYPSDCVDPKTGAKRKAKITFFAVPQIKQRLAQLLSPKDYKLLTKEYGVEVPIERIENFLVANVCRPHNCAGEHAALAVDLRDGALHVLMYSAEGKQKGRWYTSNPKAAKLPANVILSMIGAEG